MLIFLYGPDTYRSRQKLNEIIESHKKIHKSGLNLIIFDCSSSDFQDFRSELETISMFKEKKLIVLKNVFLSSQFEKSVLDYKKELLKDNFKGSRSQTRGGTYGASENIIVFFEEVKVDEKKPLFQFLKENSKTQKFELLSSGKLKLWAKKEFEKHKAQIQPEALEKLIIFCGNDLWHLSNEIQKLAIYKSGEKNPVITEQDVEILVKAGIETDIFETIDAISSKNKKRALTLLHKHLEKGENPIYLLSMINYQFRNLLIIKNLLEKKVQYHLISKKTKLHPFVIQKCYELCKKFSPPELKKIYQKIFQADIDIKTGKIEPETALDLLIAEI